MQTKIQLIDSGHAVFYNTISYLLIITSQSARARARACKSPKLRHHA